MAGHCGNLVAVADDPRRAELTALAGLDECAPRRQKSWFAAGLIATKAALAFIPKSSRFHEQAGSFDEEADQSSRCRLERKPGRAGRRSCRYSYPRRGGEVRPSGAVEAGQGGAALRRRLGPRAAS